MQSAALLLLGSAVIGTATSSPTCRATIHRRSGRGEPLTHTRGHKADRIVAEQNFGGAMVESTIRNVDQNAPVRMVVASRGKQLRAEPISALYEQHRVHHIGEFPQLEDQMCGWAPAESGPSPDRVDALVWACTELMGGNKCHRSTWTKSRTPSPPPPIAAQLAAARLPSRRHGSQVASLHERLKRDGRPPSRSARSPAGRASCCSVHE